MNDQERAQHIGEIWIAWCNKKNIVYTGEVTGEENVDLTANYVSLVEHPERWSIKKEPKVIYVNVVECREAGVDFYLTHRDTAKEAIQAADACTGKNIVIAHPIELPEDV